jgi:hypothetical protein
VRTLTFSKPYYYSFVTTRSVAADTTYTVSPTLTPIRLSLTIKRSPSSSSLTYRRKGGVAKFTLSATFRDSRGWVPKTRVWLQKSTNGRKWTNVSALTTTSSGKASKTLPVRTRGTTYYRWHTVSTAYDRFADSTKQKVVVK